MALEPIWNIEWLNQNANRNYPISETATMKDISGSYTLPNDLIVDLVWPIHATAITNPSLFHIHTLAVFNNGISISIGYNGSAIGSVSVTTDTHVRNNSYFISGTGDYYDSIGKITIGDLANTLVSAGVYKFSVAGARLEPTVIRPDLRAVTAITVTNFSGTSEQLYGDIELVAGSNIQLVVNGNAITINAISGVGLNEECECSNLPENKDPIKTINGIGPDANGDFKLLGSECLKVNGVTNGIQLDDECSSSCCGCAELQKIIDDSKTMQDQINTLLNFASRLEAQVTATMINLIASKTGDVPCGD